MVYWKVEAAEGLAFGVKTVKFALTVEESTQKVDDPETVRVPAL